MYGHHRPEEGPRTSLLRQRPPAMLLLWARKALLDGLLTQGCRQVRRLQHPRPPYLPLLLPLPTGTRITDQLHRESADRSSAGRYESGNRPGIGRAIPHSPFCGGRQSSRPRVLRNEASTGMYSARLMEINTTLKTRLFIGGDSMPRKSSIAGMKEGSNAVNHEAAFYEYYE